MKPLQIVTVPLDDLRTLIREAIADAQDSATRRYEEGAQALSLARAARLAQTRRATVLAAMRSGALPARRFGSRWSTTAAEVSAWVKAGRWEKS